MLLTSLRMRRKSWKRFHKMASSNVSNTFTVVGKSAYQHKVTIWRKCSLNDCTVLHLSDIKWFREHLKLPRLTVDSLLKCILWYFAYLLTLMFICFIGLYKCTDTESVPLGRILCFVVHSINVKKNLYKICKFYKLWSMSCSVKLFCVMSRCSGSL